MDGANHAVGQRMEGRWGGGEDALGGWSGGATGVEGGLMGRKAKGGEAVSRYFEPIVSTSCGSEVIGAGCCRPLPA